MAEKIKIDGKEYDLNDLSDEIKGQLQALRFTDAEIQRLQAQLAVVQTARGAYAKSLSDALGKSESKA